MLERQKYELLRAELRNARLGKNLSQNNLANQLKKPQSYVSKVESGERRLDIIEYHVYCDAIGIDSVTLLKKIVSKF